MSDPPARMGVERKEIDMNKVYRVVRLDNRSTRGQVPVTAWTTRNLAMAYVRHANSTRVGRFAVESKKEGI